RARCSTILPLAVRELLALPRSEVGVHLREREDRDRTRGGWEPGAGRVARFEEHEPAQQRPVPPSLSTPTRFEVLWSGLGAGARGGELADKAVAAHLQPPCEWRMSFSMTPSLLSPRWTPTEWHFWAQRHLG
ncbi:hypothetical protein Dimus_016053, partial [Dionaea muscipula]